MWNMKNQMNRLQYLDIAKGIAIILMVLGHSSLPATLQNYIFAFHMPLFFIASGMVTKWDKYDLKTFCIHKVRTLMLPFMVYSVCVLLLMRFTGKSSSVMSWIEKGWQSYALWFIPVLFFSTLLVACCMKGVKKLRYVQYPIMVLLVVLGGILSIGKVVLPWSLSTVPYATFFILLGSEFNRLKKYIEESKIQTTIALIIVTFGVSCYWHLDMVWNIITPVMLITIGAVAGTLSIFMISRMIENYMKVGTKILSAVGRETYVVVAFSQIIIMLFNKYMTMEIIPKYICLMLVLIALVYIKNGINKLLNYKLL